MEKVSTFNRKSSRMTYDQIGELNGMVPPQAVELEKSVLGALMLDKDKLFGTIDKIHEGLFYRVEHQAIFAAIRSLVNSNHDVDLLTVTEQLMHVGKLEEAGGAFYLSQLTSNVVSAAHIDYHLHILTEKYMKREIIRTSTENIRGAYDDTTDAIDLLDKAEKNLLQVNELSFKKQSESLDSFVNEAVKKLLDEKESEKYIVPSGFIELDRCTSGFQPGQLIILAARPAMGKTACGISMARNIAVDFHRPVAFFSLEMSGLELLMRLVSSESGLSANKLKRVSSMHESEKQLFVKTLNGLRDIPIFIDDTEGLDIFELRSKCRRLKKRHDIQMVFIDYLQLMKSSGDVARNQNRALEIGNISRQLKEMAKELNIPVLAMAQLNRNVDDRPMQVPILSDLKDSGSIEQDADIVIAIHRPWKCGMEVDEFGNSTERLANLHILKHRAGSTGVIPLQFEARCVRFSNMPTDMVFESKMNADIKANDGFDANTFDNPLKPDNDLPFE